MAMKKIAFALALFALPAQAAWEGNGWKVGRAVALARVASKAGGSAGMEARLRQHETEHSILVGSVKRWYRLYNPASYQPGGPVVLLLHGGSQSMREMFGKRAGATNGWLDVADREGALIVVPNGANGSDTFGSKQYWHDLRTQDVKDHSEADDVGFLTKLVDKVVAEYRADGRRVYVTGVSNGGMMTYRLLVDVPEHFAAAAAFIGSLPGDTSALRTPPQVTPLLILNGTKDPLVKWAGGEMPWGRGNIMPIPSMVSWWVRANHADEAHATSQRLPHSGKADCYITQDTYPALSGGAEVVFYTTHGGGHTMPTHTYPFANPGIARMMVGQVCDDMEGAEQAWAFMQRYRR